jgi:hypothetical protein
MKEAVRRLGGQAASTVAWVTLILTAYPPIRLTAQAPSDTIAAPAIQDTTRRLRPFGAAWRSLLVPGWGQAALGRDVAGAALVAWEGVTIMMTLKARQEVRYFEQSGSAHIGAKRQEVQDWMVLWIFNHLFAGAEAFVSAHLQDFPQGLRLRAFPGGIGVSVPFR